MRSFATFSFFIFRCVLASLYEGVSVRRVIGWSIGWSERLSLSVLNILCVLSVLYVAKDASVGLGLRTTKDTS